MVTTKTVRVGKVPVGGKSPLALIAGPCVIESRKKCLDLAAKLVALARAEKIPLIFKASYDKANRSSVKSYRGPGVAEGLDILAEVKARFKVPILTDVHAVEDVLMAAQVADVLQLPAFLCRQTDLAIALGESGCVVNIKKGQFLAPWEMQHIIEKVESTGNKNILLTERGVSFGYGHLVADMRSLLMMRDLGYPVIFDATHSVQRPGSQSGYTAGDGKWAPHLARAAVATGCDAVFIETHLKPSEALSDRENCLPFTQLKALWRQLNQIDKISD
ncbi:MAG TPA: 3-deoxy-8-phosphooctulonate synthase [Kiritimatiellia bacterium]|jgi:2-dehydro-3-deoxyphosphooctonate aldolase (KDO 8-P synthase)